MSFLLAVIFRLCQYLFVVVFYFNRKMKVVVSLMSFQPDLSQNWMEWIIDLVVA